MAVLLVEEHEDEADEEAEPQREEPEREVTVEEDEDGQEPLAMRWP